MNTYFLTPATASDIVAAINLAHSADHAIKVGGDSIYCVGSSVAARACKNGSIAINVPARYSKGRFNTRYFRPGATITVGA